MADKDTVLEDVRRQVNERMSQDKRNQVLTDIYGRLISTLLRRLLKLEGYRAVNTILRREIKDIGEKDARIIAKEFGLGDKPEDVSKALKIAATIIGYNLKVEDGETVVKGCPFAKMAVEMKEPALCNICEEYVNGVVRGIAGDKMKAEGTHDITKSVPFCYYKIRKV